MPLQLTVVPGLLRLIAVGRVLPNSQLTTAGTYTVVLEMSNTGNKVPNTGNAHYLPVLEYRGYTAIKTAVGAFPGKN